MHNDPLIRRKQRLQRKIDFFRQVGNFKRANVLEAQLAELEIAEVEFEVDEPIVEEIKEPEPEPKVVKKVTPRGRSTKPKDVA